MKILAHRGKLVTRTIKVPFVAAVSMALGFPVISSIMETLLGGRPRNVGWSLMGS